MPITPSHAAAAALAVVAVVAVSVAVLGGHAPQPAAATASPAEAPSAPRGDMAMPVPARGAADPGSENADLAALTWEAPPPWHAVPNPNPMRVASYRAAAAGHGEEALDFSVARAGGTAEANVQRWRGQFDDANRTERRESRQVHGLDVRIVEIAGTYLGGAMMPGAPTTPHSNWSLLAAIVAPPTGAPYFFKLVGPSSAVANVHASFDRLIGSIAPR